MKRRYASFPILQGQTLTVRALYRLVLENTALYDDRLDGHTSQLSLNRKVCAGARLKYYVQLPLQMLRIRQRSAY